MLSSFPPLSHALPFPPLDPLHPRSSPPTPCPPPTPGSLTTTQSPPFSSPSNPPHLHLPIFPCRCCALLTDLRRPLPLLPTPRRPYNDDFLNPHILRSLLKGFRFLGRQVVFRDKGRRSQRRARGDTAVLTREEGENSDGCTPLLDNRMILRRRCKDFLSHSR